MATRRAINACINATADLIPGLMAGSADLTENNGVALDDGEAQEKPTAPGGPRSTSGSGSTAWAAVMNGLALHGGVLPVGGTFFVFSDYMRRAVRLAALSRGARHLLVDPRFGRAR